MLYDCIYAMLEAVPNFEGSGSLHARQANGLDLPTFAINLDRRPDRWHALTHRFRVVGIDNIVRAPAVDGAKLSRETLSLFLGEGVDSSDAPPECHLSLTRPAVGCFLSHLSIWKRVAGSGLPRVMVMEDDASPTPDFDAASFAAALQSQPRTGILFPGCAVMSGLAESRQQNGLVRVYYFNGTFAYIVSAQSCAYLLRRLLPMRMHIDHQISHLLFERREEFPGLSMQPAVVQPDWSLGSDCYVALRDETGADRAQRLLLDECRNTLEAEGRRLRPGDNSPMPQVA